MAKRRARLQGAKRTSPCGPRRDVRDTCKRNAAEREGNDGIRAKYHTEGGVAGEPVLSKKVPNARFQGLDLGEATLKNFPCRVKKSRK